MGASTHARGRATEAFEAMGPAQGGNVVCVTGRYSMTANPSANDVFQMVKIPAGAMIIEGWFNAVGAAAFIYTVGDGDSTARFVAATTMSASTAVGTSKSFSRIAIPYTYATADTIDIKMTAVAASTVQSFSLTVFYLVDGQDDTTSSGINQ